jgi:3',5'-cyclic AMP phosphodiesterase CpdA
LFCAQWGWTMKNFSFNSSGGFRICQITDIHLDSTDLLEEYGQTFALMRNAIRDTKPGLVVITGDIAWGKGTKQALVKLGEFFEETGTLWAPVLGNHDGSKSDSEIETREQFAAVLLTLPNTLFELGEKGVDGNGNYIITVGDENNPEWVLYLLDSHLVEFHPSQLQWYRDTSASFPAGHSELAFFHIPVPEYAEVWDYEITKGFNMEQVCPTDLNDGLFAAMVRAGAMRGTFAGHDHINDFEGTLRGIRLCYGRGSGYQGYGLEGFAKGARIIDLKKGEKDFDSFIYLDTGEQYHQERKNKPKLLRK